MAQEMFMAQEFKELRKSTGLSQSKFANYFGIPKKSIQNWEINATTPPPYILGMMRRILELERNTNNVN